MTVDTHTNTPLAGGTGGDRRADAPSARITEWAFDQSPFAVAVHDTDLVCLRVNDRMCRMFEMTEDQIRGRRLTDALPGPQFEALARYMRQVLDTGEPVHRETYRKVPGEDLERAWSVSIAPLKDERGRTCAVWVGVLDITEQYRARQRLALVNEASTAIGSTLDITRTARELVDVALPRLADVAIVDLLDSVVGGGEPRPGPVSATVVMRRVAHGSAGGEVPSAVRLGDVDHYPESSPAVRALTGGEPVLTGSGDPAFLSSINSNPQRVEAVLEHGLHSLLTVPIRARGITLGVATFLRGRDREPFGPDDVPIAEELTARAAVCLDNARRYSRERATALALQRSLLPQRFPEQSAVEVAGRYLPASTHSGVGGDWFDVIPLSGSRVALVAGDVVGHGLYASAAMGRLRTAVRTLADLDLPPDELLTHLDDLVARFGGEGDDGEPGEQDPGLGATCVYAVYDPVSRLCCIARAGHCPPALVTPDGTVDFLDVPAGLPLGLGGLPFESVEMELPVGSTLVLYTNGLVESRDHDIDEGLQRLRRALTRTSPSLETTCEHILGSVLPERPMDDAALLVARTRVLKPDQVATWDIPTDPAAVADARRKVTEQLSAWGLGDAAFVTELVASELVTNAIRHAEGPIRLRLILDRTLTCEVSDGSETAPHLRRARAFDEGGRGLLLVAQLTQSWGTRHTAHGKTIWAEQTLLAQTPPGVLGGFGDFGDLDDLDDFDDLGDLG
ncbi:SpoIIE family protein phosphatase [Actinomadura nitritigenes]|uniref:SpoIIE family protein phosphatase n=1 Tax=Actinomadura nitritigenes TaxID=134602 RepID=A0ABS3QTE9_9ACTN|nr:SpoIIE family protein phosphatase [Actinomadura nitritigenes]MBO2437245.1 SpoIIE family protein phosphatase [Actinomadura nitritigenes]